jgi:hypothetical protein
MIGRSGWLGASECIYTTWGLRSLISPSPNSTTRPSLRITLKSERSYDQPVMRRCVYSSCSYGPLLRTASGRPRIPTTCCRVMPGSSFDIFSPVVHAEKRETTERASNNVFMGCSVYQKRRQAGKAKPCASLVQTEIARHRPMIRCSRPSDGGLQRR